MAESSPRSNRDLAAENEVLRAQLAEAQELVRAIQSGAVDALVVSGPQGEQVFTLQGAEYAYRALVEAMNEGAATLSSDGIVLYCNRRLADLVEAPEEKIIGTPVAKLIAPGSDEEFAALFANALAGESGKAELKLTGADRRSRSAYLSLSRIEGQDPSAICMVVTDLREHKKRDELIAAGELARSILASAAEAIAVCDNDGVIISANEALRKLCGFNPLYQAFDSVLPLQISGGPEESVRFSVLTAVAGENFRAREVTFRCADGKVLTLLLSAARVLSPSGIAGCVLTLTEITERKRAEEALRESEERFRALVTATSDVVYSMSPDWSEMRYLHGRDFIADTETSSPTWLQKYIPPEDQPRVMKVIQEAIRTRSIFELEHRIRRVDGSLGWTFSRAVPLRDTNGEILEWFGAARDITGRKQAEDALLRSEKLAALGRMAASIAHEVNNPLEAAINAIFIARNEASLSSQGGSALDIADQELRRAAHITSRTLGFYRDQNKRMPIELPVLIDEVIGVYARKLQERGVTVHRRYRCCACPQACFVANAGELRQVISNLLMNGMDAIQDGGTLHLRLARLSTRSDGGAVIRLTFADTGSGIRAEHLSRVFEPFFTTKETGTGLGMWISHEIIRKYGGSIRVRSKEGKGTVCCVSVPAMTVSECNAPPGLTGSCAALKWGNSVRMTP